MVRPITPPNRIAIDVENRRFKLGDKVRKVKGSNWHGTVCGFYSTKLTPIGICVESDLEEGSVQIYPQAALEPWEPEFIGPI